MNGTAEHDPWLGDLADALRASAEVHAGCLQPPALTCAAHFVVDTAGTPNPPRPLGSLPAWLWPILVLGLAASIASLTF